MKNQTGGGLLQCIENMNDLLREFKTLILKHWATKSNQRKICTVLTVLSAHWHCDVPPRWNILDSISYSHDFFKYFHHARYHWWYVLARVNSRSSKYKIQYCQLPDAKNVFTVVERFLSRLHILMVHIYHVLSCWVSWHFSLEKQMCKNEKGERRLNRVKEKKDSKIQKAS